MQLIMRKDAVLIMRKDAVFIMRKDAITNAIFYPQRRRSIIRCRVEHHLPWFGVGRVGLVVELSTVHVGLKVAAAGAAGADGPGSTNG